MHDLAALWKALVRIERELKSAAVRNRSPYVFDVTLHAHPSLVDQICLRGHEQSPVTLPGAGDRWTLRWGPFVVVEDPTVACGAEKFSAVLRQERRA
jgi:hypothetical protein